MQVAALENFRRNLRTAMDSQSISQRAVAEKAGTSYPYVNRVLMGHVEPSLPLAERLAKAVGRELPDLIGSPRKFAHSA